MAGGFEIFLSPEGYRFRLTGAAGEIIALSGVYPSREAASAAIDLVRESAAAAPVSDHTLATPPVARGED